MHEMCSSNLPAVTGICDPNQSQARCHGRMYVKITSESHYDLAFSLGSFIHFPNSKPKNLKKNPKKACTSQFGQIKRSENDFES